MLGCSLDIVLYPNFISYHRTRIIDRPVPPVPEGSSWKPGGQMQSWVPSRLTHSPYMQDWVSSHSLISTGQIK